MSERRTEILLADGSVIADDWVWLRLPESTEPQKKAAGKPVLFRVTGETAAPPDVVAGVAVPVTGRVLLPLPLWLARKDELAARVAAGEIGVWIDSFEEPEALPESLADLNALPVIGLHFPRFVDGRAYSAAFLLRNRYGYKGQLRALGDVLRDQLFYLRRVGFDAFALREGLDAHAAAASFADFPEVYQTSTDQPQPLFRRA
ncbi:MAG: DUF934 domain-containing protein [Rhodocyclaceae bacterium]|nr:DUF934 domain-containing protein [Rhodocyclaceae bacterium]MBX3670268.1 DUF934 domain-containing protein [Rhodocyclaceae bacterium]